MHIKPSKGLGELLRGHRLRQGLTQEELASLVKPPLSVDTISKLERGCTRPYRHTIDGLGAALKLGEAQRTELLAARGTQGAGDVAELEGDSQTVPQLSARAPASTYHNLPAQPGRLIGREQDVHFVASLIDGDARLLTLSGPGGVGKTRLALAVVEMLQSTFRDGAWFVDLSALRDPTLVMPTVARALRLREVNRQSVLDQVISILRHRQVLLILDNCEQVLASAPEIATLLAAAAELKVLTTSREPLRLRWEQVYPVLPLAVPDLGGPVNPEGLGRVPAVALFLQCARAADPTFALSPSNARSIAELSVRLDGLPLAIELAAARVRVIPPQILLERLPRRPELLSGARDAPTRHQSLRAAAGWSYDLLDPAERVLFRRLGVFVGGCTLDAAESVCNLEGDLDVLAGIGSLTDRSLLRQQTEPGGEPRYRMLETIREYAFEQLEGSGEVDRVRRSHALHFAAIGANTPPKYKDAEGRRRVFLDWCEREHDNFRAALEWAKTNDEAEIGLGLASALETFWLARGYLDEGMSWLEHFLSDRDAGSGTQLRATALLRAGTLANNRRDPARATALLEASLVASEQVADDQLTARILSELGHLAIGQGDLVAAHRWLDQSLALSRSLGHGSGTTLSLLGLGWAAELQGDMRAASQRYHESLTLAQERGDERHCALALRGLASLAYLRGEYDSAIEHARKSLLLLRDQRHVWGSILALELIARGASAWGQRERAARLAGAADALRKASGWPMSYTDRRYGDSIVDAEPGRLRDAYAAAWAEGQRMSLDQAIDDVCALQPEGAPVVSTPGHSTRGLTAREREVAALIARGLSNRMIAAELVVSKRTADGHVANILDKLTLETRAQVAVWAVEHDLGPAHN